MKRGHNGYYSGDLKRTKRWYYSASGMAVSHMIGEIKYEDKNNEKHRS